MIYEHCLLYDGEIIPFPSYYEMNVIEERPHISKAMNLNLSIFMQTGGQNPFLGFPSVKRGTFQEETKPCVALLGVNSTIREEAAIILFGKNVWHLSSRPYVRDDKYHLWETHAKHFRYVVTTFDDGDVDLEELRSTCIEEMKRVEEDSDHFDQTGTADTQPVRLSFLKDSFKEKRDILQKMSLKSLSVDFSDLCCSSVCCRRIVLQNCLICLGRTGPWSMLNRAPGRGLENRIRINVRSTGLRNDEEKKLLHDTWGLEVDCKMDTVWH